MNNRIQPIAVRDILRYLIAAAEFPADVNRGFDVGGTDVLTYLEMMRRYAKVAHLRKRIIVPVKPLSPWLSAHWVGLVTPVPNSIARPLVGSLIHEAFAHEHDIAQYVPDDDLLGFDEAVQLALGKVRDANVETRWSTAVGRDAAAEPLPSDPDWSGGSLYVDERCREVNASAEARWRVIEGVRGANGGYSLPLAWSRVEEIQPGELLRLRAEMRVPGRAWLEMRAEPAGAGRSVYRQRAIFVPRGLAGHAYWASVVPFHGVIFKGMARNIALGAEQQRKEPSKV